MPESRTILLTTIIIRCTVPYFTDHRQIRSYVKGQIRGENRRTGTLQVCLQRRMFRRLLLPCQILLLHRARKRLVTQVSEGEKLDVVVFNESWRLMYMHHGTGNVHQERVRYGCLFPSTSSKPRYLGLDMLIINLTTDMPCTKGQYSLGPSPYP